jgi:hypothetical protein
LSDLDALRQQLNQQAANRSKPAPEQHICPVCRSSGDRREIFRGQFYQCGSCESIINARYWPGEKYAGGSKRVESQEPPAQSLMGLLEQSIKHRSDVLEQVDVSSGIESNDLDQLRKQVAAGARSVIL